ncbi:hypothetical protein PF010_g15391 [Phytophthora fragariae]|uniref:Myb/SANT-like DNA-binding domain-containing protein n=2 Tax=Phytophthora fragariae TaxID=53985 RepID=A0A6A4D5Y1_9STRA|nr:hypothetical protein PF010_g15391 [Phytophthora fragariae]KAE9134698.1 hypothetical protein PF006_g14758 [Phytophthora fragariae]KAE9215187.1 hypothetical protein PF004_g14828 [Phytophthora fragariae]KAE9299786.1 hypothetical protein PF001_g15273 [Phytophthora fragariae]
MPTDPVSTAPPTPLSAGREPIVHARAVSVTEAPGSVAIDPMEPSQVTGGSSSFASAAAARSASGAGVTATAGSARSAKGPPALCWTIELVDKMFSLRYEQFAVLFKNIRNKHAVHRGWIAVAKELGKKRGVGVSSKQCQDKMKAMRRQWAEYKKDLNRTGNDTDRPRVNPRNLDTMMRYWGQSQGMDADTLFDDATGRHQAEDGDNSAGEGENTEDEDNDQKSESNAGLGNSRGRLTTATAISEGLKSLSQGMSYIGDSLATRTSMPAEISKLTAAIESQQEELSRQTESIQSLIELLKQRELQRL